MSIFVRSTALQRYINLRQMNGTSLLAYHLTDFHFDPITLFICQRLCLLYFMHAYLWNVFFHETLLGEYKVLIETRIEKLKQKMNVDHISDVNVYNF